MNGIIPSQTLKSLIAEGRIKTGAAVGEKQIQPASMDLRLGHRVWRVRASFLPGPTRTVKDRLQDVALHEIDLTQGAVVSLFCDA